MMIRNIMLYLTKVKKFGMVSLTGIILGLLNLVMGSGVLVLIFGIIFGVLGDVILRAGKYQSWKCTLLGNGVFSLWIMGYVSRMFLTRDTFFASLVSSYGQEYVDTLLLCFPLLHSAGARLSCPSYVRSSVWLLD